MPLIERNELSEKELSEALDACAKEPIRIPGSIQPFGAMLIASEETEKVLQASGNTEDYLGETPEFFLGRTLEEIFDESTAKEIREAVMRRESHQLRWCEITWRGKPFDVSAHYVDNTIVVELEPAPSDHQLSREFFYEKLRAFSVGIRDCKGQKELFDYIVDSVREITAFDRVKLYQFDEDWNGEVVAEAKADFMPGYLRLHFPASDIPPQARELYARNFIRQIVDVDYAPVPLVPPYHPRTHKPTDMTHATLRSVSPVHVQYLANMGVRASMSVSIIANGKLWGLVACHHNSTYSVPHRVRMCAEIMGHIFSAQMTTLVEKSDQEAQQARNILLERLEASLQTQKCVDELFEEKSPLALNALKADGMALYFGNRLKCFKDTPSGDVVMKLINAIAEQGSRDVFSTRDAGRQFADCPDLSHLKGGVLACPLSRHKKEYILWFRNSVKEHVKWAGSPEKNVEETRAGYRLSPRSSFALWKETVHNRSHAWTPDNIETARRIVVLILENERHAADNASRAKSEFLANMSHELRTPMNAIIGVVNILARDEELSQNQKEFVSTLRLSANSLLNLINDLLDISKIEANQIELEAIEFNVADVFEAVRSIMHVRAGEKDIQLNIKCPDKKQLYCIGDALRLRQILLNLTGNAIKFTDSGFVNLSVKKEAIASDKATFVIDVTDTGVGMTPHQIEKIFDKFVQADESISRRYGGTGLGLSITKHLVDLMGGSISVQSQEGMGSKFTVRLTLPTPENVVAESNADNNETEQKHAQDAPYSGARKRILLAEDYQGNIVVAITLLQSLGYETIVAENGKAAIHRLENEPFDLVLMDVQMPEMDGYTATKIIRRCQREDQLPHFPIIGMTAHALAGDKQKCLDAGMDDYIAKPFDPDHLEKLLEKYIRTEPAEAE